MTHPDRSPTEAQLDTLLKGAHLALDQGDVKTGRELSHQALNSISVGVARAEAHDTVETLTHRSDQAMYQKKKARPSPSRTLY